MMQRRRNENSVLLEVRRGCLWCGGGLCVAVMGGGWRTLFLFVSRLLLCSESSDTTHAPHSTGIDRNGVAPGGSVETGA